MCSLCPQHKYMEFKNSKTIFSGFIGTQLIRGPPCSPSAAAHQMVAAVSQLKPDLRVCISSACLS